MLDLSILVAVCAIIVTAAALCVDAWQTRSIGKINAKVAAFQQQDIGESFGDWLIAPCDDEEHWTKSGHEGPIPTNLQLCASQVGSQIAGSFKMGLQGIASGEARTVRSVQNKIVEHLQTPETKALIDFCDNAGIPRELASVAYQILDKQGLLPKILRNNGQGGISDNWQV